MYPENQFMSESSDFHKSQSQIERLANNNLAERIAPNTIIMRSSFVETVQSKLTSDDMLGLRTVIYDTFASLESLSQAFIPIPEELNAAGLVDIQELKKWYITVSDVGDGTFVNAINTMLDHIKHGVQTLELGHISVFLIILENPIFLNPENLSTVIPKLSFVLSTLNQSRRIEFAWSIQESILRSGLDKPAQSHLFLELVGIFQQFITLRILARTEEGYSASQDEYVMWATQALGIFAAINSANDFVPYYEFYNEAIEASMDLKEEYPKWKSRDGFSFCNHPFVLSTAAKGDILKIESMIQMRHELQDSFFRAMFIGVNSPYLQLEVRRDHIIRDALYQLEGKRGHDLKKQLRISFVGEEGIDEGGVQKEFFQLLVREMFNSSYGMFVYNHESRLCWFSNSDGIRDQSTLVEYSLIGRLLGLAIYNGVVLDIHFPVALYKKLLNIPCDINDLSEFDPALGKGLATLLTMEGNVEDMYGWTFNVQVENAIGQRVDYELKPDGGAIPVTNENRQEFVDLYADLLLNKLPQSSFAAFQEGFHSVMEGSAVSLFRPEELQELICGSPSMDFQALEESTQYDGFEKTSSTIISFWEVVHAFSDEQKKLLLFFVTGSDRVPVGGLGKLQFVVARNGTDDSRVPTSHTCYNVLLLSDYSTKDVLETRLLTALANSNCGFFLN